MEQWGDMEKDGFGQIMHQKHLWLMKNAYQNVVQDCFFCEYASQQDTSVSRVHSLICKYCPARQIDPTFDCTNSSYDYFHSPHKFYNKLKELFKEKEMDIKEAYKVMQAEWVKLYDVKVGTKVKVLRGYEKGELGLDDFGIDTPDQCRNKGDKVKQQASGTVSEMVNKGILVDFSGNEYTFPFFVLEVVGQPEPKKMTVKEISEMAGCTVEVVE